MMNLIITSLMTSETRRLGCMHSLIHKHLKQLLFTVLPLVWSLAGSHVSGQLLYTTLNNANPTQPILGQINTDGTGNSIVGIPGLAEASETQYSHDGRLLAVSGKTIPQSQQNQISRNVFVFDTAISQTRQITNFTDIADPFGNRLFTDAAYKSFSPDGSIVAVGSRTLFITPSAPQGDAGRTLTFFRVSDGQQLGGEIMDTLFNGTSTGGTGLSWSPTQDLIAYPRSTPSINPLLSGPTPISGFNSSGQFVADLTTPTAGTLAGPFSPQFVEHDMFPSFSPDGRALAYFRSRRIGFGDTPSELELRINSQVSGDNPILTFTPGQLPLGLSWSPDGTQLAVSIGNQITGVGGLRGYEADPTSASIGIVDRISATVTPFVSSPSAFPEYFPGLIGNPACDPNTMGDLNGDGEVNFTDFLTLSSNFGTDVVSHEQGDIDCNGTVEFADFLLLSSNFGSVVNRAATAPEPGGGPIFAITFLLFAAFARRNGAAQYSTT